MKFGKTLVLATVLFAQQAFAETIDLGVASNYNVFVFNNFQAGGWNTIGGAVAVGGYADISQANINNSKSNTYALVAGGNLKKGWGNLNGKTWVKGTVTRDSNDSYNKYVTTGASPVDFTAAKTNLTQLSTSLASTSATGSVTYKNGTGGYLTGTGSQVEYFTLTGSDLTSINNWSFSNILSGATIILNVSGSNISITGGWSTFGSYNTLFNFYNASTVNLTNIDLAANILAVNATITGASGTVNGTVVANNWNNGLTLGTGSGFAAVTSPVPEPHTYVMLLMGLAVMLGYGRYKKSNRTLLIRKTN